MLKNFSGSLNPMILQSCSKTRHFIWNAKRLVEFYSNQSSFYVVIKKQTSNEIEDTQDQRVNERIK